MRFPAAIAWAHRQAEQKYEMSCSPHGAHNMPTGTQYANRHTEHLNCYAYLRSTTETKAERLLHWPVAQPELARDVTARPGM